jgi:hypothetical protein
MTRAAIMQPYLFPYVGYFQLLQAVDVVVWLDDAQMVPRTWIVRNRVLVNGAPRWFSLPVHHASQRATIGQSRYALDHPDAAAAVKTLKHAYGGCTGGDLAHQLGLAVLQSEDSSVASVNEAAIRRCLPALGVTVEMRHSSDTGTSFLRGSERILEICRLLGATTYVNLPGGRHIYRHEEFARHNVGLRFIQPEFRAYPQPAPSFVPGLSILDAIASLGSDTGMLTAPGTFSLDD